VPYLRRQTWLQLQTALARAEQRAVSAEEAAAYWRSKAEKLLDAALLKRGEVTDFVFSEPPAAPTTPVDTLFRAMSHQEIDSSAAYARTGRGGGPASTP